MIKVDTRDRHEQRKFGLVMGGAFFALGALRTVLHWYSTGGLDWPHVLWSFAVVFAAAGLLLPRALFPVFRLWIQFSVALNWVMTRLFLTVAFYLLLTPVRLFFSLKGEDALKRAWNSPDRSYWEAPEEQPEDVRRYRNQF
ncbi:MAG: hypothetical protein HYV27_17980 [Candidatus Hydrogenedentes bacterium]|nr:hypothetical protein [Candidatus Hydrogenedentota bacterium]